MFGEKSLGALAQSGDAMEVVIASRQRDQLFGEPSDARVIMMKIGLADEKGGLAAQRMISRHG